MRAARPQPFEPEHAGADLVLGSRGYRRGLYAPRGTAPAGIVIHTTGAGPTRRFEDERERRRHGYRSPFDAALRIYAELMNAGPHYLVGQQGQVAQLAPESLCAWHVGGRKAQRYHRERWQTPHTRWWERRWDLRSPRDLAGGRLWAPYVAPPSLRVRWAAWMARGSCNANTLGIEVVPSDEFASGPWSAACWDALTGLIFDLASRHAIPLEREHVLTHSDAHPLARSAHNAPWDTSAEQFVWDRFVGHAALRSSL